MRPVIKVFLLFVCIPFTLLANKEMVISGNVSGVLNGTVAIEYVYGLDSGVELEFPLPEKVKIEKGKFVFRGELGRPILVRLKISTKFIDVFLENTAYTINTSLAELTGNSLKGGEGNDFYQELLEKTPKIETFIKEHGASPVAGYFAYIGRFTSFDFAKGCYESLSPEIKASWYGLQLKRELDAYGKHTAGIPFPNLGLLTRDGTAFSLQSEQGKIIVLDFWASWCAPCRAYIPTMKEHYASYKDRGVDFISVSVDESKDHWVRAMDQEQMPWQQVLAEGGFKQGQGVQDALSIYNIPFVIILGKDGKIAASLDGYHVDNLKEELDKLVQ